MSTDYRADKDWPYAISCGGVVCRQGDGGREYALLYREPNANDGDVRTWHLPKGTLEKDEILAVCAQREIAEETGLVGEVRHYLGALHTQFHFRPAAIDIDKTTHYFLLDLVEDRQEMDDEHDGLAWVSAQEAQELLKTTPKGEGEIIRRAEQVAASVGY